MGVIQRQGLKSTIIGFIGIGIGAISTLYIYPKSLELLGLFRTLFDTAVLVGIPVLLGSTTSAIRFFPRYRDTDSGHNGLLTWLLIVAGSGFLIFLVLFPFLKEWMVKWLFHDRNSLYEDSIYYLVPLTFFAALLNLLSRYISNFRRITVPAIFEHLTIKFALPAVILMYLQGWIDVTGFWVIILTSYFLASLCLVIYLAYLGELRLTKPVIWTDKPALKEYSKYSWYGLLSGMGSTVAFRIDTLMVTHLIQLQYTGIYSIAATLSEVIIKPMRSLNAIAGPVISHHLETGNLDEVRSIYRKSSLNMTIIGVGLFFMIWTVLPYIFDIMPNTETVRRGSYVVFFLGIAQVWDMMTGVNSEIISYSRYYRVSLYLTLFLAVLNVGMNYLLIPLYGLTGAALATCISMFLFNAVKLIFIKIKYDIIPFSARMIPAIGLAIASYLVCRWLPDAGMPFVDLLFNAGLFCVFYGVAIWKLDISPDINHWIGLAFKRLRAMYPGSSKS
jgi:O-antigen/teichoic acid export membrane protein